MLLDAAVPLLFTAPRTQNLDAEPRCDVRDTEHILVLRLIVQADAFRGKFNFVADQLSWYAERERVRAVLDALLDTALGSSIRLAGEYGSTMRETPTRAAIHDAIATGKNGVFGLTADHKDPPFNILLTIVPGVLAVEARCMRREFEARRTTVIDDTAALAAAIRRTAALRGLRWGVGAPFLRTYASYDYPRPRPPRRHDTIRVGALLDTIDLAFHNSNHPDAAKGARELAARETPPWVHRAEEDGLLVLRWADDVGDEAQRDRGCSAHEEWLASVLPTIIDGDYNELGDEAEPMHGLEPHSPLTMYDGGSRTGYVAVLVEEEGPDPDAWQLAVAVARDRRLPDGTPVARVRVVVQLREVALAFRETAKASGIDAVLYPADDGSWWNPDPPGSWAYPPRRAARDDSVARGFNPSQR